MASLHCHERIPSKLLVWFRRSRVDLWPLWLFQRPCHLDFQFLELVLVLGLLHFLFFIHGRIFTCLSLPLHIKVSMSMPSVSWAQWESHLPHPPLTGHCISSSWRLFLSTPHFLFTNDQVCYLPHCALSTLHPANDRPVSWLSKISRSRRIGMEEQWKLTSLVISDYFIHAGSTEIWGAVVTHTKILSPAKNL